MNTGVRGTGEGETGRARIIDLSDPGYGEDSNEVQGHNHNAAVSVIVIDAPPGSGPKLHRHPYEEVFVIQEGTVTFTAGDGTMEAKGGQVVVVPPGVPHKFVNRGKAGYVRWTSTRAIGSSPNGSSSQCTQTFQSRRSHDRRAQDVAFYSP